MHTDSISESETGKNFIYLRSKEKGHLDTREKTLFIASLASEKKAGDVVVLDMRNLTSFTDYFVICTGDSTTQVKTIAEHVIETLGRKKIRPAGLEGMAHARWVLMDYGDVVVHVFEKDTRAFYGLDKLWLDAPRVELGQ